MKNIIPALLLLLFSCSKDPAVNPTPVPPVIDSSATFQEISLTCDRGIFNISHYELIVTDITATYLLDTILSVEDMHTFRLKSNYTKFNITIIDSAGGIDKSIVQTFYQVRPQQWHINPSSVSELGRANDSGQGEILYYNLPPAPNFKYLFQIGNGFTNIYEYPSNEVTVIHKRPLPYYSLLLIPNLKRYKFYEAKTAKESVDAATMDTAKAIRYKIPFEMRDSNIWVSGNRRKNDFSTYIQFWRTQYTYNIGPQEILYPPTGFEQYIVGYSANDKSGFFHYTQKTSDVMPATMEFLDAGDVHIVKNDPLDIEVEFPKTVVSGYALRFEGPGEAYHHFTHFIHLPVNKKNLKGISEIIDLSKSKLLKTFDFTPVKFTGASLYKGDDLDYSAYFNKVFDKPDPKTYDPIKQLMYYNY